MDPAVLGHAFENRPANYISVLGHQLKLVISAWKWAHRFSCWCSCLRPSPLPFTFPPLSSASIGYLEYPALAGQRMVWNKALFITIYCLHAVLVAKQQKKSHFKTFPCKYQSSNINQWSMLWQCRCSCDHNFKSLLKCLSKHTGSVFMSLRTIGVCSLQTAGLTQTAFFSVGNKLDMLIPPRTSLLSLLSCLFWNQYRPRFHIWPWLHWFEASCQTNVARLRKQLKWIGRMSMCL